MSIAFPMGIDLDFFFFLSSFFFFVSFFLGGGGLIVFARCYFLLVRVFIFQGYGLLS